MTRFGLQLEQMEWESTLNEQTPISLGWKLVPAIAGAFCYTWIDGKYKIREMGIKKTAWVIGVIFP